jgi:hypothetical protein
MSIVQLFTNNALFQVLFNEVILLSVLGTEAACIALNSGKMNE